VRFVQVSDLHLGASLATSALGLPLAKREQRRRELAAALRATCDLARNEGVDAILLPGDLFDHEGVSRDTLAEAIGTLAECRLPVVIAPGNHDFYSPSSYYEPDFVHSRHGLAWPANVHVFPGGGWRRLQVPGIDGVTFTGIAFTSHDGPDDRPLQRLPQPEPGITNVLVFHGSRLGYAPPGKHSVLPFSDAELQQSGYTYAALGHYHSRSVVESGGRVLGAYSGCPAGRGLDECGPKGVLVGELTDRAASLRFVPVDRRVIHDVVVDCTGVDHNEALLGRIERCVRDTGCRECDIVYVRLTGRHGRTLEMRIPPDFLSDNGLCYHLHVDATGLAPDYDVERYRSGVAADTVEGRFVREIEQRLHSAADEAERDLLRRALYYGLDALVARQVTPRYEVAVARE
jgi:DNA repair exonuclease SbcCD nuclease subunit